MVLRRGKERERVKMYSLEAGRMWGPRFLQAVL
jgi:hypothetical protein